MARKATVRYQAPPDSPTGRYTFSIGLADTNISPERIIEIGLKEALWSNDGFYRLAAVEVHSP